LELILLTFTALWFPLAGLRGDDLGIKFTHLYPSDTPFGRPSRAIIRELILLTFAYPHPLAGHPTGDELGLILLTFTSLNPLFNLNVFSF